MKSSGPWLMKSAVGKADIVITCEIDQRRPPRANGVSPNSLFGGASKCTLAVQFASAKRNKKGPCRCSFAAAALMNCYALWLGIDILARGIRSDSVARANFGLLLIAVLAISRFFDSELSFVTRGLGFILVGAGFLIANILMFKKRTAAAAT